jgi:predicted PurR-regulated permease PerM
MHYKKMELHEIVTNMSVLFGIYRFGVAGIFYGPLIIITFQCVQKELFKKYARNNGKANHGR